AWTCRGFERSPLSDFLNKHQTTSNNIEIMYHKEKLARIKKMNALAPELMNAFWAFDKLAVAEGAIPVKYKELMAIAVGVTTQCPYCVE
ncbi:carboxymuconolactone decarboxylase family protein, partial [Klebsiella pneumoniae]